MYTYKPPVALQTLESAGCLQNLRSTEEQKVAILQSFIVTQKDSLKFVLPLL